MQFESFHWLSHHGIWAIIPCSAKLVSKRRIFGAFLFLVSSNFLYFGGVFNRTIIPFALVGYEIGYSQLGPCWLFTISYPTSANGIIVKYSIGVLIPYNLRVRTRKVSSPLPPLSMLIIWWFPLFVGKNAIFCNIDFGGIGDTWYGK